MPLKLLIAIRKRNRRGQVAVAFVALMGLVILLTPPLMNLGEVARLKTATANAADAGALAGASWIASGTNEAARVAAVMLRIYWITQSLFFVPFCLQSIWLAEGMLQLIGWYLRILERVANSFMNFAFRNGRGVALLTAIHNASIDDPTGDVDARIQQLADQIDASEPRTAPPLFEDAWVREGVVDQPSGVRVEVDYPGDERIPVLVMSSRSLFYWYWIPSCLFFCFPAIGWNSMGPRDRPRLIPLDIRDLMGMGGAGRPIWVGVVWPAFQGGWRTFPRGPRWCGYYTIAFWRRRFSDVKPSSIAYADGTVTVTVTRQRDPAGAQLAWWTMQYPDTSSQAVAEYGGAFVNQNVFRSGDRAQVNLRSVR